MVKITLKDKKILYELNRNSRQSLSKISKKVGLSKQVVNYRIKRMVNEGVITSFKTMIDITKFGYTNYCTYIRLKNISQKRENEIIDFIKSQNPVRWLISCTGRWDIAFTISAKNIVEFNHVLNIILEYCKNNLDDYKTSLVLKTYKFMLDFLIKQKEISTEKIWLDETYTEGEIIKLDKKDTNILGLLQNNSRISLLDIAEKTNISPDMAKYRIKNLMAKKIISGFGIGIDFSKIGYNWYQVLFHVRNVSEQDTNFMMETIKTIPNVAYIITSLGTWDLELHIYAESNEHFREILMKIKDKLANYINSYDTMIIFAKHKSRYMPEVFCG